MSLVSREDQTMSMSDLGYRLALKIIFLALIVLIAARYGISLL